MAPAIYCLWTHCAAKKAANVEALKIAKGKGKEVLAAERVHIVQERLTTAESKKAEKLRLNAAKQTEKARIVAEKKALKAEDGELKFVLQPDDPANFLKLSSALCLLIKHTLIDAKIEEAVHLICNNLCPKLWLPAQFWTFLFEQLNNVPKSFKTNNHSGGELKTTFLIFIACTYSLLRQGKESLPCEAAEIMLKTS
ncbi:hypothetical protein PAXRUDRAFT_33126 [Paxillus rubicundulus Ve08.2h10]|uniref:Uncharacterized protein n=1 Tax=Paxillus rubicundulus Ve08.2h10 TaxID=930991 RepID=A0A0D0E8S3_9AGAM|nr:hypothetical protein PAXRUDRAFT_33126 [Paxillus rubicundulus Ve08.2h10]